jgi:hypothetical protein
MALILCCYDTGDVGQISKYPISGSWRLPTDLEKYLKFYDIILAVLDNKISSITNYYLELIELSDHILYTNTGQGNAVEHLAEALC